ncbi:MAG: 2-keto-4-pentenoate hydratase [Sphingomonadaceae bacterium]
MTELSHAALSEIAERLDTAAVTARAVPQLAEPLTLADAYRVQSMSMERRYARGERRLGIKMGFTSRAKMIQMGIDDMIWGRLTTAMALEEGAEVDCARYVHPRVEPEIAFLLRRDVTGPVSLMEAQAAVEAVAPGLELIDSRYQNFKFSLTDVIADNSSSSGFMLGGWTSPKTNISNLGMILEADGDIKEVGSSAAILGNPWRSLVAAIRLATEAGEPLRAGDLVMAGGATAAIPLATARLVRLEVHGLGRVDMRVKS